MNEHHQFVAWEAWQARDAEVARLVAAVRDDVLSADAIAHVRRQVKAMLAQAEREAGEGLRTAAERRRALEREVGRMVEAIATVGVSPALAGRLRQAEAELASLAASAAAEPRVRVSDAEIDAAFRRLVMRLQEHLQGDVMRARPILAELLGPVTIAQQGEEVWAEAAPDTAALLQAAGGGVLLSVVAGGRFGSRKRWRIT
jgi:hypothetical protein